MHKKIQRSRILQYSANLGVTIGVCYEEGLVGYRAMLNM